MSTPFSISERDDGLAARHRGIVAGLARRSRSFAQPPRAVRLCRSPPSWRSSSSARSAPREVRIRSRHSGLRVVDGPSRTADSSSERHLASRRPIVHEIAVEGEAPTGKNRLAGDVGGFVRGEEGEDRRHLFRAFRRGPSEYGARLAPWPSGRCASRRSSGEDGAGRDGVHPDAAIGEFERERAGEIGKPALAQRIAEKSWLRDDLMHARGVDDRAAALRARGNGGWPIARNGRRPED